ncbi:hypothetical protein Tco_0432431, partial [Tanacetum coccineum]
MCFSAPPTSPDCMVVGFPGTYECIVLIHFVAREPSWRRLDVGVKPTSIQFPTFVGQDLYVLGSEGELICFKDLGEEDYSSTTLEAKIPVSCCITPTKFYLMKCDQDLLKVIVGKFGELVDVFKWNDSKQERLKVDNLGKHAIYICGTTCLSIEAKTPEMENKIFFPLLCSKNKKIVFYSLETGMYHTFNGMFEVFHHLFGLLTCVRGIILHPVHVLDFIDDVIFRMISKATNEDLKTFVHDYFDYHILNMLVPQLQPSVKERVKTFRQYEWHVKTLRQKEYDALLKQLGTDRAFAKMDCWRLLKTLSNITFCHL